MCRSSSRPASCRAEPSKKDVGADQKVTLKLMAKKKNRLVKLVKRGANRTLLNDRNQTAADLATVAERPWLLPVLK